MPFPDSFLEELHSRVDILDVVGDYASLKKKGNDYYGLCPFHAEKTPSFSVSPDSGMFYCFGCHKGGDVIHFLMEAEGIGFSEAVERLAQRAGMPLPDDAQEEDNTRRRREQILELNRQAARWFHDNLSTPEGARGADYLRQRGLSAGVITRFGLGVAPNCRDGLVTAMAKQGYEKADLLDAGLAAQNESGRICDRFRNRVMFPIIDVRGKVVGFGGRVLDDAKPKYLNSPDTLAFHKSRNFFALNLARKSKQGYFILTEGYMDTIALHQAGFDCAVASLGTALTEEHVKLLSKYTEEVILCYDADEAGMHAAQRAIRLLERTQLRIRVLRIPENKDPDEYIRAHGAAAFAKLLEDASGEIEYRLDQIQSKYDLEQDEQKVAFLQEAAALVAGLASPVEREIYARRCAESAGVAYETVDAELRRLRTAERRKQKRREERKALSPARNFQPEVRALRYQNVPSARAEEGVVRLLLRDDAFFAQAGDLRAEEFSSPTWGKIFSLLRERRERGESNSAAALAAYLTSEEMSLLAEISEQPESPANGEQAMADYIRAIRRQRTCEDDEALMAFRNSKRGKGGVAHE